MTEKDKYLFAQLGLTFLLLIAAVFLIKPALFGQYQLLLIGGSSAGFAFGWFNRKRVWGGLKYLTDAFILITLAWIGWRIFKSTFLYKEVITIFIQGIIVLEVIFSFNTPAKIAHLRLLSVLIFMTSPVFAVVYSLPLAIGYLLLWLAILRSDFAGFLQPLKEKGWTRYYSLAASLACFLAALLLAWFLSANVYLGQIKKGAFFLDEDMQDLGSGSGQESNQADKFYSLQEDLLSKITGMALEEGSYEKRRQLVYLLSELVKETLKTIELDKAETGLIDILKRQGEGLEGASQAMTLTKEYLGKKNSRNLGRNKEEFMDKLRNQPLDIFDKIKITSLVNKLAQANSDQQRQENSQALQTAIQKAPLNQDLKKELSALVRNISNLKAFELYRRKMQDLEQGARALDEKSEKKITEVISDIQHTQSLDDFKQAAENIRQLKNDPGILESKSANQMLKGLEEISRMKLDLLFTEEAEKIRGAAAGKQALGSQIKEFDRKMDGAASAMNHDEFIKEFSGLDQENKDNNLGLEKELSELLDLKTESFKQAKKDRLDDLMRKDFTSEVKKDILEALKQAEESESLEALENQQEQLAGKISELERKNNISSESVAELLKAAADLKDLLQARLMAGQELKKKEVSEKGPRSSDYLEQLQQAIEDSSLSNQEKQMLKALSGQLLKAQNLSQLEEVKEALDKEISSLGLPAGVSDKERKSLSAVAKSISADLEKKINNLENVTAEQIRQLLEYLKKMQQSQDARQLQKTAEEFKEEIKNTALDKQEQAKMLEAIQKLNEILNVLLEKKAPTVTELRELSKINEKIKQATQIKQQFLASQPLADILAKIERLSRIDAASARLLEEKVEQLRKSAASEETGKIIEDLKEMLNNEKMQITQEKLQVADGASNRKGREQLKILILSGALIISPEKTAPLKVISVDSKGNIIKELTSDVEWFSTLPQVAWVDNLNFLHSLAKGQTRVRAVYKGAASKDVEVNVVEDLDGQTVAAIKQELAH